MWRGRHELVLTVFNSTSSVIVQLWRRGQGEVQRATEQQLAHPEHFQISQQPTNQMLNLNNDFIWFTRNHVNIADQTNHNEYKRENPLTIMTIIILQV